MEISKMNIKENIKDFVSQEDWLFTTFVALCILFALIASGFILIVFIMLFFDWFQKYITKKVTT
jgi:hypothetical protein